MSVAIKAVRYVAGGMLLWGGAIAAIAGASAMYAGAVISGAGRKA